MGKNEQRMCYVRGGSRVNPHPHPENCRVGLKQRVADLSMHLNLLKG